MAPCVCDSVSTTEASQLPPSLHLPTTLPGRWEEVGGAPHTFQLSPTLLLPSFSLSQPHPLLLFLPLFSRLFPSLLHSYFSLFLLFFFIFIIIYIYSCSYHYHHIYIILSSFLVNQSISSFI